MIDTFNRGLLNFLAASPTPFHAVENMANALSDAGFTRLREGDEWDLQRGGRYFITRNDASIIAFVKGLSDEVETGIRMVGAHTDSPNLKLKPQPDIYTKGYWQLGVEVYGGVLRAPWMDRDLSLAGRVTIRDTAGQLQNLLVNFEDPIAIIPNLAIHLDREANDKGAPNPQEQMAPVLGQCDDDHKPTLNALLLNYIEANYSDLQVDSILDHELSFYDVQRASLVGINKDFIASARLDNLLSCYIGLEAMISAGTDVSTVLICTDHEEVGSMSATGAQGPMLESLLRRWLGSDETVARVLDRSMMISVDNAHGVHPNYVNKHDNNHGPLLNQGPVIKINANQRYATTSETSAQFRTLCADAGVACQAFVTRADMGCGSTIGPITAAELGVKTIDVGVPTFAMHSIRELAGSLDSFNLVAVLKAFYVMKNAPGAAR